MVGRVMIVMVGVLVASAAATGALLAPTGPWAAGLLVLVWSAARAPAGPIVDAGAVHLLGPRYGRVRAVGSVAFLVASVGCGLIRDVWGPGPIVVSAALTLVTLALTPPVARALPPRAPIPPSRSAWLALWRHPVLVPLAAVSLLHGAAMSSYDNLFALHVERLGLPAWVTGAGIAGGVSVEVGVLVFGAPLLARFGAPTLLAAAVASSIPRFAITADATHPAALIAAQGLHGIGFGAFWLAATSLFAAHSPPGLRNSAQGLLVSAMFGAGPVLGLLLATQVLPVAGTAGTFALAAGLSAAALGVLGLARRRAA